MATKFTLGLGVLESGAQYSTQGGFQVAVFSGSYFDKQSHLDTGLGVLVQIEPAQIDPVKVIVSQDSAPAYHSTLFEDFGLRAEAVYNFYTADEQTDFRADASASLRDLPRYVFLSWNPTPVQKVFIAASKELRPPDPRNTGVVPPILQIGVAKTAVANGYVAPGALQALLVAPQDTAPKARFDQDLFLSSPSSAGANAADHQHVEGEFHVQSIPPPENRTRVNFVDPSIAGALDPNRVSVAVDHAHLATLGAFAKLASGLEVISEFNQDVPTRNPPPKFPAPGGSPYLTYLGYVIERYSLDSSGSMTLTKTIDIDDAEQTTYVDREVLFGGRYVYRMKSIVQWTRPGIYGFEGASTTERAPAIDTSLSAPSMMASFYSGDWSDWARTQVLDLVPPDPPDELTVRPVSRKGEIHVTWRMPGDPQRDISALRLLRSTVSNGEYGDWVQLGEYVPANGMYVDHDVRPWEEAHTSYMYAMYSLSLHGEHSMLSERIEARLTDRSQYLGEEPVRQVGPRGDDPFEHARGAITQPETELVVSRRASVYVRGGPSALPLFDRGYVVEVQSLATGQRAEIDLNVDTTDVDLTPGTGRGRA